MKEEHFELYYGKDGYGKLNYWAKRIRKGKADLFLIANFTKVKEEFSICKELVGKQILGNTTRAEGRTFHGKLVKAKWKVFIFKGFKT